MATTRCEWLAVYVILSSITSRFDPCTAIRISPNLNTVKEWAVSLDSFWDRHISTLTGLYTVRKEYRKDYPMPKTSGLDIAVSFEKVDTPVLVTEMATGLSEMLGRKMEALQNSVEKAEIAAANHSWDDAFTKNTVFYENAKDIMDIVLTHDERFGQKVNFSTSSVHIPVEIYDGDLEILNGLNWTSQLDKVFEENYNKDPEILWQYFGSQAGFMRTYPASAWTTRGKVDLYDVRRQSWYTQGSSSPKDMMILIDTSGSTHGQALQLMKVAVKSILDTLGENDFVNIAEFSSDAKFVSPCFNHTPFVQANYRNKQKLSNDVNHLTANGMANFKVGLKFAFEQFQLFERNETVDEDDDKQYGASCNKVIMMLTDGGTDNAEEIFKEFNWPNKTVRVFTYAVGPTANPTNAIRWMACANRGYFSPIPAMGAIRTRVQEYVGVLARPLAIQHIEHAQWSSSHSNPFVDIANNPGLGMMTTVTLPVYNRTAGSSNQTILGVMGIDVTTADMVKKSPKQKLGANGYSYAINPNGYIIFHPNLKATNYMRDPPNVDLLEIEIASEKKNDIRTAMIKQQSGTMVIETYVLSPDMKYVYKDNVTYSYQPIKNTSFSLGMSVPSYQTHYPKFNGNIQNFDRSVLKSKSFTTLIAPWNYYANMTRLSGNLTGTIQDITDIFDSNPDSVQWDKDLLYHLYWDAKMLSSLTNFFELLESSFVNNGTGGDNSDVEGHVLSFFATNGGLTRIFPPNESASFMERRDPMKAQYYKRIQASDKLVFYIDEPYSQAVEIGNNTIAPDVTVGQAVTINSTATTTVYKPAVVGTKLTNKKVLDSLIAETSETNYHDCGDSDTLICYLVNDGGFLIASNQEEHNVMIGQFLGKVDPPVMSRLLNMSVYERIKHYDYQVIHDCAEVAKEVNAGFSSFRVPSINLLYDALSLNWWTTKFAWAYFNFNFWNSFFSSPEVYGEDDEDVGITESCVEVMYVYYYGSRTILSDRVDCDNCTRFMWASRMEKNTNLLLVVADPICQECDEYYTPLPQEPVKVSEKEEEEVICDMARTPRYRRPIQECYSKDPREDATKCDGMSSHCPSTLHILTSLAVILFSVHCLTSSHS